MAIRPRRAQGFRQRPYTGYNVLNERMLAILRQDLDPRELLLGRSASTAWHRQLAELLFLFCVVVFLVLIWYQAGMSAYSPDRGLMDYGSLYGSASLANARANPYQDHPLVFHLHHMLWHGPQTKLQGNDVAGINLNPPVLLYPFRLLARLDPTTSFFAWTYISLGLFVASVALVVGMFPEERLRIRLLWVLALSGVWATFMLGQIYMILLLATTLAWWCLRQRKWVAAGIAIGVVCAIKPNFLVWPVLLILGRSKKSGLVALATTSFLAGIPLILQGPLIYQEWIAECRRYNGYEIIGNSSLLAIFSRAGIPNVGAALTVLMLAALALWAFFRKPDSIYASEIAVLAALLAGPISWTGYTILLIPVLYGKRMDTATRVGCVLLCIPFWVLNPAAQKWRIAYILLDAPNFYALILIGLSALYCGARAGSGVRDWSRPQVLSTMGSPASEVLEGR